MPRFGAFDRATGTETVKLGNGFGSFVTVCRLKTAISLSDARHPKGPLSKYQHIDEVVSTRLMTLNRQTTDIDTKEKQYALGKMGLFQLYRALKLFIETQHKKPPKICPMILVQLSLILVFIKYYEVKRHVRGHQYKLIEDLVSIE